MNYLKLNDTVIIPDKKNGSSVIFGILAGYYS